jgi:RND family efflux transporter MFP subunit
MLAALLMACRAEVDNAAPEARPVRVMTVERREAAPSIALTGRIQAEDEVALAFRISGRIIDNSVKLGDRLNSEQLVARLESQNELNGLRSAQANLAAAEGRLVQASNHFDRQKFLLARDATTQAVFDDATQALQTARSQVDASEAQLKTAQDLLSFTELKADAPGVVTVVGPGAGEVVQAGQMIVRLARQGGRDAVFDLSAPSLRSAPADPLIVVSLTDDPAVSTTGRIREVAPQADPVTRTFEVKVGLIDPPAAMRLGATVSGRIQTESASIVEIPTTAITQNNKTPAVWVIDPGTLRVSMRNVEILRTTADRAVVTGGLDVGEIVVTAGVRTLHPDQKVRLLGSPL